ncbi:MAG: TonB-dependent receptor [Ignavibacteriaceae bacterium]|nr:TonB-dependent receptor [Ignavibacteriaceae bacterium]
MKTAKRFFRTVYFSFIFTITISQLLFSQGQSGKLSGTVIDAQTNEPLPGVNVVLEGTTLGAATNFDGRFFILNIPPGIYNVTASMVGYAKSVEKEVEVFIDRTTELDFKLQDASVQIEQVVVVAKRPPVVKDRTSTYSHIDDRQISVAPLEGIRGALDLNSGFQRSEKGDFLVRGSGSYEVNFQINGIEQTNSNTNAPATFGTDKANNSWKYDVNPLGVKQLQLITGGFSAEYGNAQAGVVKVVLKDGAPKITGEFRVEYRPSGQYHYGPYLYDHSNFEWKKWGDLENWMAQKDNIIKELKLDLRYDWLKNTNPDLYEQVVNREIEWAHELWVKNHEPGDENVLGVYDYRQYDYARYLFGFGGPLGKDPNLLKFYISGEYKRNPTRLPTPEKVQVTQNYILNLTYQPVPEHKLRFMTSYQSYYGGIWSGSTDIRWSGLAFTPPGVSTKYLVTIDPVREEQTIAQTLNWIYTIDTESFAELTLTHQQERYEIPFKYLAGYGLEVDRADSLNDPSGTVLREGSWWEKDYFRAPFSFSTNYYQDSRTENFGLKLDYTNQLTFNQLIKSGVQINYWDMINNGVNSSFQANTFVARNGFADYYKAYPISIGAYIQNRMEYSGMITNIGLRAEIYNFQTQVPVDPYDILYPGTDGPYKFGNPLTKDSETKFILLPRIGVSFPIGESTAFRIQYGHFASLPIFSEALSRRTWVGWQGIGNANLDHKKTINYEFGLQQQIDDNHRLDLVLYYNDRVSQIGTINIASTTGFKNQRPILGVGSTPLYFYSSYANNAFGSTIGFEVTFETFTTAEWSYRLSYSLSQTTSGNYGPSAKYPDNSRTTALRNYTNEFLAGWDRTHNFRALLQYFTGEDEGLSILGFKPFENSVISMTYSVQSGVPFTYVTEFDLQDVVFNRRYPLESSVDLNFVKNIQIESYKIILGIRVMNLFENKWITPMTSDDLALWIEQGVTMMDPGNDPERFSYLVAPYRAYSNIPRQVFFTLGIGF